MLPRTSKLAATRFGSQRFIMGPKVQISLIGRKLSTNVSGFKPANSKFQPINSRFSQRFNSTLSTPQISEISTSLPQMASADGTAERVTGVVCDHIGALADGGIVTSYFWPSDILARVLEAVYVSSGLPWWATIAVVAVGVRLIMVPAYLKSSDTSGKLSKIQPELNRLNEQASLYARDPVKSQQFMQLRRSLMKKSGVKFRYLMVPLFQIPLAIGMFNALRSMANYPVDGFSTGGLAWFTDLSSTDPYCALPILTAATFVAFIRLGGETGSQSMSKGMKNLFTALPILSIAFTYYLSAAVVWYFAVNSLFSICQTTFLKNKFIRKYFGLADIVPKPAGSSDKGFMDTMKEMKKQSEIKAEQKQAEAAVAANFKKAQDRNGRAVRKSVFKKEFTK